MVEATAPSTTVAAESQPAAQPAPVKEPPREIGMCEHQDSLQTYCQNHD